MADFPESNSLDPEKLVDLRALLAKPSSSAVHRSQTVPNKVGRTKAEEPFESLKPVSRSYTMPILGEGADADIDSRPLMLGMSPQRKTVQGYRVEKVDSGTNNSSPLYPLRRSLSVPRSNRLNTKKKAPPGRRVLILWIVSCFAFLIIPPLVSSLLGGLLPTPDFNYTSNNTHLDRNLDIILSLVSADPLTSVATFDWLFISDPDHPNEFCPDPTNCTDVNIFIDSNLLASDESANNLNQSTDVPTAPIFRINANNWIKPSAIASSPIFRTNIRLFSRGFTSQSSLVRYPFDVYLASITMFAQDATNQTVGLNVVASGGNAIGFSTSAVDCDLSGLEVPPSIICMSLTIERGVLVRAFCILVTIAIWLITMALLLLTLTSIIFGFRQRVEVLVVPVATIFAFTQLRSSMPGAPAGFGDVLDFAALLPCLGILAFSAALSLGAFILADPEKKEEVLTWRRLRTELLHAHKGEPTNT